jgi:Transcriptional regulator
MVSLKALRHFSVLAEERHYSKAASRLHLTQSALSRSIQSLESQLNVQLLDRSVTGLALTPAGRMVLEHAHRVLNEASTLKRRVESLQETEGGEVLMGAGVFPAAGFLSPLLTQVARDYPGIRMRVEVESWQRLQEMLVRDELDFVVAITRSLPPSSDYQIRPLPPQHVGLFVRAGHPLLSVGRRILRTHLPDYRLASTHLPPRALEQLAPLFGVNKREAVPLALECNSIAALVNVALGSDLIILCVREALRELLAEGRLVQLPLSYTDDATLECNLISHARRELSPASKKVVGLIEKLMTEGTSLSVL